MRTKRALPLALLLLPATHLAAQQQSSPAGLLQPYAIAQLSGSGADSIQALITDPSGNLYLAANTTSPDLPVLNAAQPAIGDHYLFRSLDLGQTWQPIPTPVCTTNTVTPHPTDPQTIFLSCTSGIYKTSNAGQTWHQIPLPTVGSPVTIVVDPNNPQFAYALNLYNQLYVSENSGESWSQQQQLSPSSFIEPSFWVDPIDGAIGVNDLLSHDHAVTWTKANPLPGESFTEFIVPDPQHPQWIYAAGSQDAVGALYLSKDWGTTWNLLVQGVDPIGNLLIDPDRPATLYATTYSGNNIYITNDGGATWRATTPNLVVGSQTTGQAILGSHCSGGAIFSIVANGSVSASLDSATTFQFPQLRNVTNLASGPGCAVYALKPSAGDAFISRLTPTGKALWSTYLGGSGTDTVNAAALDPAGNLYVAGQTQSSDFPVTIPSTGSAFLAKFDSSGNLLWSTLLPLGTFTALTTDSQGSVFAAGNDTDLSKGFNYDGFAAKISPQGALIYSTTLPNFGAASGSIYILDPPMVAILPESSGTALVGGSTGVLTRISADGSTLSPLSRQPGRIYSLATSPQGDIVIAGTSPVNYTLPACVTGSREVGNIPATQIYLNKLDATSLQSLLSTSLTGGCVLLPGNLQITPGGDMVLGAYSYGSLPLKDPFLLTGDCGIARFSGDSAALVFSTYIAPCVPTTQAQVPPVALAPDGSALTASNNSMHTAVIQLPTLPSNFISVTSVANAFSGSSSATESGMLVTLSGENLAATGVDLGLVYTGPPQTQLGGVQVLFDGIAAQLLQVAPDHIICVTPDFGGKTQTTIQVTVGSQAANPIALPIVPVFNALGYLTTQFPALPTGSPDGYIQNADGSQNGPTNPAKAGSTVTLFATGLTGPGALSFVWNEIPSIPFVNGEQTVGTAFQAPGLFTGIYAVHVPVPTDLSTTGPATRNTVSGLGIYVR